MGDVVERGERTFAPALRGHLDPEVESVVVSVDAAGRLVETALGVSYVDPKAIGTTPDGLLVVSVAQGGPASLVRLTVAGDGSVTAAPPEPLPDITGGWPHALTSDGARATLRHAPARPDRTMAEEVTLTIDLGTRRVVDSRPTPPRVAGEASRSETEPDDDEVPGAASGQRVRLPFRDGLLEASWDGGSGMRHAATSRSGTRRYQEQWTFAGGLVRLLRREGRGWIAVDPRPFPLRDAAGRAHGGYAPVILRNGLHAAVLLAPGGGPDLAWFQPYRAPCTAPSP